MNGVLSVKPLGFPWETTDPFLTCVYHRDLFPAGNDDLGPAASLAGRRIGSDFEGKDGWRMYHGSRVPGFPQHPHRGFETVTIVRQGLVDHSDSLGATARFGQGDVQWLTAGKGIVHAEMFPLLERSRENPLDLFQIWLNLPPADKMVEPHFSMLWAPSIPVLRSMDSSGRCTEVTMVAGSLDGLRALAPPPHSRAASAAANVAIWTIKMAPDAEWAMPAAVSDADRTLYFFKGNSLQVASERVTSSVAIRLQPGQGVQIRNGPEEAELLLLQGRPIGAPVAQYGPFVMNSQQEIQQAILDYRRTGFGGWPWPSDGPVHARGEGRFARHVDGRVERAAGSGPVAGPATKMVK